ncbi:MAG: transglycosylase domain-containing protein, partial [Actinomycetota bacterium]
MSRSKRIWRRVGLIATWFLGLVALLMVSAVVLFYTLSDVPRPEDLPMPQVATVQFADGSTMARIGSVDRTVVPLSKVPESVRWAVLATEDRNFYTEPGVSIKGTLRAAINDLTGGDAQGGSGITQQYVKNAYLNSERTLSRKLKELAIAVKLARNYSKNQILEWYLNTVYFGRSAYGIESAAEQYFGTSVDKLSAAQGALLAALLRSPNYYDPAENLDAAKRRWHYVIDAMVATGHLGAEQAATTVFPKTIPPKDDSLGSGTGPTGLIVRAVKQELATDGIDPSMINTGGLRIQTTIDKSAQAAAVAAVHQTFTDLQPWQRNIKPGLVAVDPRTGGIIASYGGSNGTGFDYAMQGWRPPGSSFKPYTLATALTQNVTKQTARPLAINSVVDGSSPQIIGGTLIANDPSDKQYSGPQTVVNAMKYSLNTVFDRMAYDVGPANVARTAHAAGIAKTRGPDGPPTLQDANGTTTFGIGIGDYPVRPVDQAVGFATFANGGTAHTPHLVQKVTDAQGSVLFENANVGSRAFDPRVANDVTMTLEPVAAWSGVALANGRPSASKTGTAGIETGPDAGANSDAWMVGFTPQVSTAVWVGSGRTTAILNADKQPEYGRDLPGRAWKSFMDSYLTGKPASPLPSTQQITNGVSTPKPTPSATSPTPTAPPTTA